jgi:hypothetical protein
MGGGQALDQAQQPSACRPEELLAVRRGSDDSRVGSRRRRHSPRAAAASAPALEDPGVIRSPRSTSTMRGGHASFCLSRRSRSRAICSCRFFDSARSARTASSSRTMCSFVGTLARAVIVHLLSVVSSGPTLTTAARSSFHSRRGFRMLGLGIGARRRGQRIRLDDAPSPVSSRVPPVLPAPAIILFGRRCRTVGDERGR